MLTLPMCRVLSLQLSFVPHSYRICPCVRSVLNISPFAHAGYDTRRPPNLIKAVDAFDPGRDVDSFIEKRRTADNAPLYGVALSLLDWARSVPPPSTSSDDRSHNKNASRTDNDSTAPANAFQSGDGSSSGGVLSVNNSGGGNTADERNAGGTESVVKAVGGVGIIVGSAEESSGVAGAVVNATNVAGGNRDGAPSDGTPPGTGSPPPIKSTNPFDASFVDETDQRVSDTPASDSGDRADSLAPSTMNDNLGREGTLGGDITLGGEGTIDVDALLRQLIPGPQRARVLPTLSGRRLEQVQPVGQDAGVAVAEARVFPSGGDEALDTPAGDEQQELLVAELEGIMVMSKSTSDAALTTAAIAAAAAPSVAPAASVMATAAAIAISAVTPEESGFPGALTGIPTYKGEAGASTAAVPIAVTSQLHNADVAEPKVEGEGEGDTEVVQMVSCRAGQSFREEPRRFCCILDGNFGSGPTGDQRMRGARRSYVYRKGIVIRRI